MTWRLYHCNSEIRPQLNYLIKIYLYLYDPVFYLLNGPDWYPLKMLDLVLTVQSSTYELHERLLCEIIEQHKGIVVNLFIVGLSYRMTALTVKCAWTSVKYL